MKIKEELLVEESTIQDDIRTQKMRDNFEESLQNSLQVHGLSFPKRDVTSRELMHMQKFLDNELTFNNMKALIDEYGEKWVILNCFNSSRYAFMTHMDALKKIQEGLDDSDDDSSKIVSEELGKELLNSPESTIIQCNSVHFNNDLGDNAGQVSRREKGYIWQLFVDDFLHDISIKGVQKLLLDRYQMVVTEDEAAKIGSDLNHDRRTYLGDALQGKIGDSLTVKTAVSMITNEGIKKSIKYEDTNIMGQTARKMLSKYDSGFGRITGEVVINNGWTEKTKQKLARLVKKFIEDGNGSADDFIVIFDKVIHKK